MEQYDIGIVVPLAEEFRVLAELCTISDTVMHDGIDFYTLDLPGSSYRALAVVLGEMGPTVAGQVTEKMLHYCDFQAIVLLGIAGALDKDLKLGDIVVAQEINEFLASSKAVQKAKSFVFKYSGKHWPTDFALWQRAQGFEFSSKNLYNAWQDSARELQAGLVINPELSALINDVPAIKTGHIASGDTVGASKAYAVELKGIDRKFLALEMEAAGFARSAHGRLNPVRTMIIRGVSDLADERKAELDSLGNGDWRRYAMHNASTLFLHLLKTRGFQEIIVPEDAVEAGGIAPRDNTVEQRYSIITLEQILVQRFDREELRTLCFRLHVDYDNLPAEGKAAKARELVKFLERHDRIYELIEMGKQLRPNASWPGQTSGGARTSVKVPDTILIPAGPFQIGSPWDNSKAHENEKPRRGLNLGKYRIGRYPVTNEQYARFVLATQHVPPEHWNGDKVPDDLQDHPVVNVSFEDAQAYCRWLSLVAEKRYHLPTEAEWEKAARGGNPETRRYPWGDEWRTNFCNTKELGRNETASVHEFEQSNTSPFGVVDMAGNAWEWTDSWYEPYPDSLHKSPRYGQEYRVVRGGSWRHLCKFACVSCRGRYKPHTRRPDLGFRIASS